MTTNDLMTVAQAAEALNLSVRAIQHRITAGSIAAEKLGAGKTSAYVITRAEVDRVKAESRAAAAS
jgi:excisionase family DNA binding protein